jgi:hypothetical protein
MTPCPCAGCAQLRQPEPFKRCNCGRSYYDLTAFLELPFAGTQTVDGEVLDLRNCPCGSTLARVMVPHRDDVLARTWSDPPADLAALLDDTEPYYSAERRVH